MFVKLSVLSLSASITFISFPYKTYAYQDAEKCGENATPAEMVECFEGLKDGKYAACFDDDALAEFQTCMEAGPNAEGEEPDIWGCGTVMNCAWETFVENATPMIESFDECIHHSIVDLFDCGMTNLDDCAVSCGDVYGDDLVIFNPNITLSDISSCDGFQTTLVAPSCTVMSCCEMCQDSVLAVHQCYANTYVQLSCNADELTCSGDLSSEARQGGRRDLGVSLQLQNSRSLNEDADSLGAHVAEECPLMLVNSTTLDSYVDLPSDSLDCVFSHFLWMFSPEGVAYVTAPPETSEPQDTNSTDGSPPATDTETTQEEDPPATDTETTQEEDPPTPESETNPSTAGGFKASGYNYVKYSLVLVIAIFLV
jgi:hypothetical protein